ncbi:MAG: hypothetical protein ABJB74_10015 [Gemmatimonas sp.]
MYATCTFCHRTLGSNQSIEVFPVGQRLAFDAGKGRLWVLCTQCAQWNLSPLDERWEAIESAERLFRDSKLRHSTDNIGLAKLRDGTELVRIGKALRPEMAAWRYGQNFARRWTGMKTVFGAGIATLTGAALFIPSAGFLTGVAVGGAVVLTIGSQMVRMGGSVAFLGRTILDNEQQYVQVTSKEVCAVRLISHETGWALRVGYLTRRPTNERRWQDQFDLNHMGHVTITGRPAIVAARQLLPIINGFGAGKAVVNDAVALASSWTDSSSGFAYSVARAREWAAKQYFGDTGALGYLPPPVRLALEMSLHEDEEQRALDGELDELERMWKDAEEVAGISDGLLLPGKVERALNVLRGRNPLA